jgi:hypothetical protein
MDFESNMALGIGYFSGEQSHVFRPKNGDFPQSTAKIHGF